MTSIPDSAWERWWPRVIRVVGLAIIIWDAVAEHTDRPALLMAACGMVGLPTVVNWARENGKKPNSGSK